LLQIVTSLNCFLLSPSFSNLQLNFSFK